MFHIADVPIPALPTHPAVHRAAAWLDRAAPGWADRINPRTLNIGCATHCVLGQVFQDAAQSTDPVYSRCAGYAYGRRLYYDAGMVNADQVFADDHYRRDWLREIRVRQAGTPMGAADQQAREREAQCPYNFDESGICVELVGV